MGRQLPTLLAFLAAIACASQAPPEPRSVQTATLPAGATPAIEAAAPQPAKLQPATALAQADRAYDSQLGIARGGHFDTERQIAVLKEAVLLYGQFLERAENRPELEPAVRKSRERIADAKETIIFLEASLRAQDNPPSAAVPDGN